MLHWSCGFCFGMPTQIKGLYFTSLVDCGVYVIRYGVLKLVVSFLFNTAFITVTNRKFLRRLIKFLENHQQLSSQVKSFIIKGEALWILSIYYLHKTILNATLYSLPECQGTPFNSNQAPYLKFKWQQRDSNPQPLSSYKRTLNIVFVYELSGFGFESRCCHLNIKFY